MGIDYELDPSTRRAQFKKNNQAALVHGGYSKHISTELLEAVAGNDLGFEVGVLKGQLTNLTIMGDQVIRDLQQEGENVAALQIALSCADRASKLVPQIQRVLESPLLLTEEQTEKKRRLKNRWLKRLHEGECSASEVAYQFEINGLGELPFYLVKTLEIELKNDTSDIQEELYSREQLQQMLSEYWDGTVAEEEVRRERAVAIHQEKQRINKRFFTPSSNNSGDE